MRNERIAPPEWNDLMWPDKGLKNLAADKVYFSQGRQDFKKRLKQEIEKQKRNKMCRFGYVEEVKPNGDIVILMLHKAWEWRNNMNLLEHFIVEIISEEKIQRDGIEYYKVEAMVDCYGNYSKIKKVFPADEWKQAKEKGYYMA